MLLGVDSVVYPEDQAFGQPRIGPREVRMQ